MLSRVMTSCGGTSSVSIRMLMRVSVSMGQKTILRPAPLACGCMRPSRSTTPRSHSLMMYREFQNQISTRAMITIVPTPNSNMFPPQRDEALTCGWNAGLDRFDMELQTFYAHDTHGISCHQRSWRYRLPEFPMDT